MVTNAGGNGVDEGDVMIRLSSISRCEAQVLTISLGAAGFKQTSRPR